MLRIIDFLLSATGIVLTLPLLLVILILGFFDNRSPLLFQKRIGRYQIPFTLIKFRTMQIGTAFLPTHLISPQAITPLGHFLRKTKLDELPQLWNVLIGQMSLVGPRPCLPNQVELIAERAARGIYQVRPGITGIAQIQQIDMSDPVLLANIDQKMLQHFSMRTYFQCLFMTLLGKGFGDHVGLSANQDKEC